jgi:hypothetical protein
MSSIFDMGDSPITHEFLGSKGFTPNKHHTEYKMIRWAGCPTYATLSITYRKRNQHHAKGEPHHHCVIVVAHEHKSEHRTTEKTVYKNIKFEAELTGCIQLIGEKYGVDNILDSYNPHYYWTNAFS